MTVYFIQVQPFGPIKIGRTASHVSLRVRALQAASPYELKWIGYFVGDHDDERAAHARFAQYRVRGEWFHPSPEVLSFVNEKCPAFDEASYLREVFHDHHRDVARALPFEARRGIAREIGLDFGCLSQWFASARVLDGATAAQIGKLAREYAVAS